MSDKNPSRHGNKKERPQDVVGQMLYVPAQENFIAYRKCRPPLGGRVRRGWRCFQSFSLSFAFGKTPIFKIRKDADFEYNSPPPPPRRQVLSCQGIKLALKSVFLILLATSRISAYAGIPAFYIHYKKEF